MIVPLQKRETFAVSGYRYSLKYTVDTTQPVNIWGDGILQPIGHSLAGKTITLDSAHNLNQWETISIDYSPVNPTYTIFGL